MAAWDLDDIDQVATLLTSEVATNAVRHARTGFQVAVVEAAPALLVEVCDGSTDTPSLVAPEADAMAGRGLHILELLASRWGVEELDDGKAVWFALMIRGGRIRGRDALSAAI